MSTRTFALIFGLVFLLAGIAGFGVIPGLLEHQTGSGLQISGMLLSKFHVNALHNVVHIVFGLWGLAASRGGAVAYFRAVAVIYGLLTILGLIPATQNGFGMVTLGGPDVLMFNVYLHGALALVGVIFGWLVRAPARA